MNHSPTQSSNAWIRAVDSFSSVKNQYGPVGPPPHWNIWNTLPIPPWQLHIPNSTSSPSRIEPNRSPLSSLHAARPQYQTDTRIHSPIYIDSPSPQRSIITISSSSSNDIDDPDESEMRTINFRTKVEAMSPENVETKVFQNPLPLKPGVQTPSPVYPNMMPVGGQKSATSTTSQNRLANSPQRSVLSHSITSIIQPKTSPHPPKPCCRQGHTGNNVNEIPSNLCYLHVPMGVAQIDNNSPENNNGFHGSPDQLSHFGHLHSIRRQGPAAFGPQLPSTQTAFSPVRTVVTTSATPGRLQFLHPCFLSPASSYRQTSVIYPNLQLSGQPSVSGQSVCPHAGYLVTPSAVSGVPHSHPCGSLTVDTNLPGMRPSGQLRPSPYEGAQLSPQRHVQPVGFPGTVIHHAGYTPVDNSNGYLAYAYYGAQRL